MARYVVIMAGGSGTRFWPKSRGARPKQFLAIGGPEPMLRQTLRRVAGSIPADRIYVVTGAAHAEHARLQAPELPASNVLIEPEGRNTAPCIAWATRVIREQDPDAAVAVLAADHFIGDVPAFSAHLESAFAAAAAGRIVLFGIVPSYPETGYGYIKKGATIAEAGGRSIFAVERFVEKPDRETAVRYLSDGGFLWNSGMFVFPAALMWVEIARLLPDLAAGIETIVGEPAEVGRVYPRLPSISIDYGVMEKTDQIGVLPASFGWSDVGSWDAAMTIGTADARGNVTRGDVLLIDSKRTLVDAETGRFVALVGVEDLMVVDTEDALLVIRRGESQRVREVVEALKAVPRKELL